MGRPGCNQAVTGSSHSLFLEREEVREEGGLSGWGGVFPPRETNSFHDSPYTFFLQAPKELLLEQMDVFGGRWNAHARKWGYI